MLALTLAFIITSCNKKSSPTPSGTTTTTTISSYPYYFRFSLDGVADTIASKGVSKAYDNSTNAILASISPDGSSLWPSLDLRFTLPQWWDTVKESDVMGMIGKTLYFTDSIMAPRLAYEVSDTTEWNSYGQSGDYVKVDSITFNGTDNYMGHAVRTYIMVGSCQAQVMKSFGTNKLFKGNFRMPLVRVTSW
ncbi:MAG: hypothetical protein JSS96_05000 [Bacteroidetes bacterium]|nr:hypothetical protein [Bacteroidota bacterium]